MGGLKLLGLNSICCSVLPPPPAAARRLARLAPARVVLTQALRLRRRCPPLPQTRTAPPGPPPRRGDPRRSRSAGGCCCWGGWFHFLIFFNFLNFFFGGWFSFLVSLRGGGEVAKMRVLVAPGWAGQVCRPRLRLEFLPHHPEGLRGFGGISRVVSRVPSEGAGKNQRDPPSAGSRAREGREEGRAWEAQAMLGNSAGIPPSRAEHPSAPFPVLCSREKRLWGDGWWRERAREGVRKRRRALKAPGMTSRTSPTCCGQ